MTDSSVDTLSTYGSSRVAAKRTPLRMAFWVGLYVALIPFVNWSFTWAPNWKVFGDFAFNPVTIVTGLILVVRDFAQRQIGHRIFFAMLLALVLTVWGAGLMLAIASGTAFFVSELIDWGLFTFTKASLPRRVLISVAASAPVDTIVFLSLASYVRIDSFSVPNMVMSIVGKLIGLAGVLLLMRMREQQARTAAAA